MNKIPISYAIYILYLILYIGKLIFVGLFMITRSNNNHDIIIHYYIQHT